jgi:hypothetical protein
MELVKLKNGSEEARVLVVATNLSIKTLMEKNPMAFYDLVEKCRNKDYKFFGDNEKILEDLSLINNGRPHESIRNIILSSVEGEGLEMTLTSPIK